MNKRKSYLYQYALAIMLLLGDNCAFAQVSSLQNPPSSYTGQNQPQGNIIEKLFSNPAASSAYTNLNADPNNNSPYASIGGVPRFNSSFWGGMSNRYIIDAGTIVNGTLEDDLSSKKNKTGDTFSILLAEGYKLNNMQLIPPNSRLVGAVSTVIPASSKKNGVNGSIQISLQTLVLPDGVSIPISASIVYNPNQPSKFDIKKGRGIPVGEYASSAGYSVIYAAGSFTRQLGFPMPYKTQTGGGNDFSLNKGELLPVKFIQPVDMTSYINSQPTLGPNQTLGNNQILSAPGGPNNIPQGFNSSPNQVNGPTNSNNTLPGYSAPAGPEPF